MKKHLLEFRVRRLESLLFKENMPINQFDCKFIVYSIQRELKDEAVVDIVEDNSRYGFINIGISDKSKSLDYDIINVDSGEFEVYFGETKIGVVKDIKTLSKLIINHYLKTK